MQKHLAVRRVKRRLEERAVHGLKEDRRINALLLRVDKRLAQRLHHHGDEEVAAEFDGVRLPRLCANYRDAARKRLQQRPCFRDRVFRTGNHDPQAALFSHVGPSEHRRCHKFMPALCVLPGQPFAQRHADGAARDVQRAGAHCIHQSVGAKDHFLVGRIVEQHGEYGIDAEFGLRRRSCGNRALAQERFRLPFRPVPHAQLVAGGEQMHRHRRPHLAETKKSNLHGVILADREQSALGKHPPIASQAVYRVQVLPLRQLTTGLLWTRVAIPERILPPMSWASLLGTSGALLPGESHKRAWHQVTLKAKTMLTRKITIIALISGIVLGAAATEGFNVYRQSHDSRIFQERVHCKAVADAYVKENTDLNDDSVTGRSVTLEKVDYSPVRNSCVAELEETTYFRGGALAFESVRDLLSGENIVSNDCTNGCEFLKLNLVNTEFDYIMNNASIPVGVLKEWSDTESIYKKAFGPISDAPASQHKSPPPWGPPPLDPATDEPVSKSPPKPAHPSLTQWDAKGNPIPDSMNPPSGFVPDVPASQHK